MDHPYSISDFAFAFRRSEGTTGAILVEEHRAFPRQQVRKADPSLTGHRIHRLLAVVLTVTRTIYRGRDREYALRASEVRTLIELGKFRVVPADDLARLLIQRRALADGKRH